MSNNFEIELNEAGIQELLKSPGVVKEIESHAVKIANRAGGSVGKTFKGNRKAMISVFSEKDDNSLLRALR